MLAMLAVNSVTLAVLTGQRGWIRRALQGGSENGRRYRYLETKSQYLHVRTRGWRKISESAGSLAATSTASIDIFAERSWAEFNYTGCSEMIECRASGRCNELPIAPRLTTPMPHSRTGERWRPICHGAKLSVQATPAEINPACFQWMTLLVAENQRRRFSAFPE